MQVLLSQPQKTMIYMSYGVFFFTKIDPLVFFAQLTLLSNPQSASRLVHPFCAAHGRESPYFTVCVKV